MDRERLVDETLMLLPTLMRLVERPSPVEMGEISRRGVETDVQVSPGHIQVLIDLTFPQASRSLLPAGPFPAGFPQAKTMTY